MATPADYGPHLPTLRELEVMRTERDSLYRAAAETLVSDAFECEQHARTLALRAMAVKKTHDDLLDALVRWDR